MVKVLEFHKNDEILKLLTLHNKMQLLGRF